MSFLSGLFGRSSKVEQIPRFTSQQEQIMNQILQQAMSGLQDPGKGFAPIEEQARRGFQQKTIPGIMERFAGMGQNRMSSGLMGALGEAGTGLETNLAAMRSQYGTQNRSSLQSLLGMGLQPQFESLYRPESHGLMGNLMSQFAPNIPSFISSLFQHSKR